MRAQGDWEVWVTFFIEGVEAAAADAERGIVAVVSLVAAVEVLRRSAAITACKAGGGDGKRQMSSEAGSTGDGLF